MKIRHIAPIPHVALLSCLSFLLSCGTEPPEPIGPNTGGSATNSAAPVQSAAPSIMASATPSATPSTVASVVPSVVASSAPSVTPSTTPSTQPSSVPSSTPSTMMSAASTAEPPTACAITATATQSTKITTVYTVEVTAGLEGATEAWVEFGKDTTYGMTAPIANLDTPSVMLLGMEGGSMYHYRVVAKVNGAECLGPDATAATGAVPNAISDAEVETTTPVEGFIITSFYGGGSAGGVSPAFILNAAGNPVWYYSGVSAPTRARMSYDGQYMWMLKANVPDSTAQVKRVKMDGTEEMDFSTQFAKANHDLTVLPDETVAFFAYGNGCDDIKLMSPDGTVTTIANIGTLNGGSMCHANAIQYSPEDETLVISDLNDNSYAKIELDGTKVWILGGGNSSFTGSGATWSRQHNFHMIGKDHLLIFNNGDMGQGSPSVALEITVDTDSMMATKGWAYTSSRNIENDIMGDVQRLPNGNTLVTYSTKGVIQQVDADKNVLQEITTAAGATFGYAEWRPTLYGKPER